MRKFYTLAYEAIPDDEPLDEDEDFDDDGPLDEDEDIDDDGRFDAWA